MSQENVEWLRQAIDAVNRRDLETAVERMDPEIEWQTLALFPDAGTYRGREGVLNFFETWHETFRDFRLQLNECVAIGDDHVLAALRVGGEGAESGAEVESPLFFQSLEFRDGQLVRARMFETRDEALEAAGLQD